MLDTNTLALLFQRQSASLKCLDVMRHCCVDGTHRLLSLSPTVLQGLYSLQYSFNDDPTAGYWPMRLIAQNRKTLRRLRLDDEVEVWSRYLDARCQALDNERASAMSEDFTNVIRHEIENVDELWKNPIPLEGFDLPGLCLNVILNNKIGQAVDMTSLTTLVLESCEDLGDAFAWLTTPAKMLRLRSLTIRHEKSDTDFQSSLKAFLLNLPALRDLYILQEGCTQSQKLEQILAKHGPNLKTLIWDERDHNRKTHIYPHSTMYLSGHLNVIARHCHGLTSLGLAMDWQDFRDRFKQIDVGLLLWSSIRGSS